MSDNQTLVVPKPMPQYWFDVGNEIGLCGAATWGEYYLWIHTNTDPDWQNVSHPGHIHKATTGAGGTLTMALSKYKDGTKIIIWQYNLDIPNQRIVAKSDGKKKHGHVDSDMQSSLPDWHYGGE